MYLAIGIFLYWHPFSFWVFNELSSPPLQKKTGVVKVQERKERWKEKKVAKRQKKDDGEVEEEEENVQPVVDALENGFLHHAQREQERMNERLLKKTYSKKNKMVSVSASVVKEMSAVAACAPNVRGANPLLRWHLFPLLCFVWSQTKKQSVLQIYIYPFSPLNQQNVSSVDRASHLQYIRCYLFSCQQGLCTKVPRLSLQSSLSVYHRITSHVSAPDKFCLFSSNARFFCEQSSAGLWGVWAQLVLSVSDSFRWCVIMFTFRWFSSL